MNFDWPPKVNEDELEILSREATDFALSNSIIYRPVASSSTERPPQSLAIHAPVSLFPSPFPKELFELARKLQPLYSDLYARISVDEEFLETVIGGNVILVDEFQSKLYEIWKLTKNDQKQSLQFGIFRSDYLCHKEEEELNENFSLKQVEFNTISSSFGPLCGKVNKLHRYLCQSGRYKKFDKRLKLENLPENNAIETIVQGFIEAYRLVNIKDSVILFIVQEFERNSFDQRQIEYEIVNKFGIPIRRFTLNQVENLGKLDKNGNLIIQEEIISVIYFRAGYSPIDYPTETEWNARIKIEKSTAIKCPSISMQLAGAKKVQQILSNPGIIEKFVKDSDRGKIWLDEEIQLLKKSFMPMFDMENESKGIEISLNSKLSLDYVLKPQREGGGNNIYKQDIIPFLNQLDKLDNKDGGQKIIENENENINQKRMKRRQGYILMKLIQPPKNLGNYLLRVVNSTQDNSLPKAILADQVISELGQFSSIIFDKNAKSKFEKHDGYLLRTKASSSNEGGVAAGYSVIDSPMLI